MRTSAVLEEATGVFQMPTSEDSGLAETVSKSLRRVDGIRQVVVNYVTDKVYVSYDPGRVTTERIKKTIESAGVRARRMPQRKKDGTTKMRVLRHG